MQFIKFLIFFVEFAFLLGYVYAAHPGAENGKRKGITNGHSAARTGTGFAKGSFSKGKHGGLGVGLCVTPCDGVVCANGGTCVNEPSSFVCQCPLGYSGTFCEITPCDSVVCENNGTCFNEPSSFVCQCPRGYTGTYCETRQGSCQNGCRSDRSVTPPCTCDYSCILFGDCCYDVFDYNCLTICDDECPNNRTCVESNLYKGCACPDGLGGQYCDEKTCTTQADCINGFCAFLSDGSYSICGCNIGWKGTFCDEPVS